MGEKELLNILFFFRDQCENYNRHLFGGYDKAVSSMHYFIFNMMHVFEIGHLGRINLYYEHPERKQICNIEFIPHDNYRVFSKNKYMFEVKTFKIYKQK